MKQNYRNYYSKVKSPNSYGGLMLWNLYLLSLSLVLKLNQNLKVNSNVLIDYLNISFSWGIILNIRIMLQEQIASTGFKQLYYALCTIYRITQVLNKFVSKLNPYSTMILAIFVTTWFGLFSSKSFYTNPNRVWPLIRMIDL